MDVNSYYQKQVEELMNGIDRGEFADEEHPPETYNYGHLAALFYVSQVLDNVENLYGWLYDRIMAYGSCHVKEKVKSGQKIKTAFLVISGAEWAAEHIYRMLEQDERLECYVIVCPLVDREQQARARIEAQTYDFFERNQYDVRRVYDSAQDVCGGWEAAGGLPDIVIHSTPWYHSLPEPFQIENYPLRMVNLYIPYGLYVADSQHKTYAVNAVYNKQFVNMQWKIYADSQINLQGYQKYSLLHGKNVNYSGYVKMDYFQEKRNYTQEDLQKIWKFPKGCDINGTKRLIIAPHHSLEDTAIVKYATFAKNAYFWLYLAEKYQDKIMFIFKPHPNLREKAVKTHLFSSFEDYDAYLELWNALPNAKVVEEGSYLDFFAASDGMIMDSCSFIGEYLYVNKPLLFLTRQEQTFNNLGEELIQGCYRAKGEDYTSIEQFIEDVILGGKDSMEEKRLQIFQENLDYVKNNGCLASESICRDILNLLDEQKE